MSKSSTLESLYTVSYLLYLNKNLSFLNLGYCKPNFQTSVSIHARKHLVDHHYQVAVKRGLMKKN